MKIKLNPFRTCRAVSATGLLALVIVLPARADYSSTVLSYNPAAYWRLNDSGTVPLADQAVNLGSVGAPVNGFYRGTAGTTYTHPTTPGVLTGSSDGATTFVGGNMLVPNSAALNTAVFTAEAWINPAAVDGTVAAPAHCALASVDVASPRAGWLIYVAGDGFNFRTYNLNGANTAVNISGGGTIAAGTWYHVAVSWDGTVGRLYVNGAQVAVSGATTYAPASSGGLTVAQRSDGAFGAPCTAEELAVYSSALSAGTIAAHYSAATTNGTGYATQILAASPVGYWRLGDATWVAPAPGTLPVAVNSGSLGASAQGAYQPGMATGAAGPGYGGLGGATVAAFNGMAGYVDLGTSVPVLSDPMSKLTLMTWAKFSPVRSMDWEPLITCSDSNWQLQRPNDNTRIGFRFTGTDLWSVRAINDGQWHHIVATYDSTAQQMKLYIDGTLDNTFNGKTGSSGVQTAYPIQIGGNGQVSGRIWNNNMSDMAIFTNALTAADIWAVYSSSWNAPIVVVPASASPTNNTFEGASVTLNVTAAGAAPLHYQWYKGVTPIATATTSSYLLTSSAVVADSATYSVVITNAFTPPVTSSVVLSVIGSPPTIVAQPASIMRVIGAQASFTVVAGGSLPRTYLWKRSATPVPGGTNATLTIPSVQWSDIGSYVCTIANAYSPATNTVAVTLSVLGEFASTVPPDTASRNVHVALGSEGTNLFFTMGNVANAPFYKIPEKALTGWTTLAPIPLPASLDNNSGVGDLGYFGGALWTSARNPADSNPRCVYRYDLALNAWTTGGNLPGDGPNAGIAVPSTTNILGGWIGNNIITEVTDWTAGTAASIGSTTLPGGGAVWPWDACMGPANAYFLKHDNVAANSGRLSTVNKTGAPLVTNITGMPFNPGMGCAIEYMPGSLFANGHACLYVLSGGANNTDGDGSDWTGAATVNQLAVYDLVTSTWDLQTLPFAVDEGSEMCLVNQTLYILAANSDSQPLKMLYMGPPYTPTIATQPASQSIYLGQSATFSVGVSGGGPYTYQWRLGGVDLSGATGGSLTVTPWYTNGSHSVVVVNPSGSVTSQVATVTVYSVPTYANLTNGLVVHLTFNSDATTDSSGRGNDATPGGSPVLVSGKLGQAVQLQTDGVANSYLTVYDVNSDFQFGASDSFSIAFWLKYTTPFYDRPIIGNAANSTWNPGYVLTENGGQLTWTLTTVSGPGQVIADPVGGPLLNDGAWHQITFVVDRSAGVARSFANGTLIDTRSISAIGNLASGSPLVIAQDPSGTYGNNGTMTLDDIGIWRRALTTMEAESIYIVGQNNGRSFDSFVQGSLTLQQSGAYLQLIWEAGTLQWTEDLTGTWTDVPDAGPSFYQLTPDSYAQKFFRVKIQ